MNARQLAQYAIQFWMGMLIFGAAMLLSLLVWGQLGPGAQLPLAIALIMAAGLPGVLLIRRGQVALGSGLLVGYALATIASFGECTLMTRPGYASFNGLIVYAVPLVVLPTITLVALLVTMMRKRS